jgi:GrpB-like predicted nucleotidyltransferase (UPF0157 family)
MIGLKRKTLNIVPYDPNWKLYFNEEKERLFNKISNYIISIEHIGSTAINNLHAKPIIDMAISLKKYDDGFECVPFMEKLGYLYKGEYGIPGRHFFRTNDDIVKFHIHMFAIDDPKWEYHIKFRDYLNNNPDEAKEYEKLKFDLIKKYNNDRELYTDGKSKFINRILKKACCSINDQAGT